MTYAANFNSAVLLAAAQQQLVQSLVATVNVAFTRQFECLGSLTGGKQADLLYRVLVAMLQAARQILSKVDASAAPPLLSACRILLAKLHQQAVMGLGAAVSSNDPLVTVQLPSKCHDVLRLLLEVFDAGRRAEDVRMQVI